MGIGDKEFLTDRAIRFFSRYGKELETLRRLLDVRLSQLAHAYVLGNNLPAESVTVFTRIKSLASFVKKMERKGWPTFYYLTEVATDLVGGRIVCWFVDDCYGMLNLIKESPQFAIRGDSLEDYIANPKVSGYRSIHVLTDLNYDRARKSESGALEIRSGQFVCEIQIRTKLQDAWGEFTHEMQHKAEPLPEHYSTLVAEIAHRLADGIPRK